jgi:hypothetical protein
MGVCGGDATVGELGQCCFPGDLDCCNVCNGDGTGAIGCPGNCGGLGPCECNVCQCPEPFFGDSCDCFEQVGELDGFTNNWDVADSPLTLMAGALSGELWVNMHVKGRPLFTKFADASVQWTFSAGVTGNNFAPNVLHLALDNTGTNEVVGNTEIPIGTWTHVAFTWNGANNAVVFYVNGVEDATGTFNPGPQGAGVLDVGFDGDFRYDGQMDDVRLWNTLRTPEQIADNYLKSLTGLQAGLAFNHNFQKTTTTKAIDYSPNSLHFRHVAFPTYDVPFAGNIPRAPASDLCPNDCNGAGGTCDCGVCTCLDPTDETFDCFPSGGGG